jgi:hypothetical protein
MGTGLPVGDDVALNVKVVPVNAEGISIARGYRLLSSVIVGVVVPKFGIVTVVGIAMLLSSQKRFNVR